MLLELDRKHRVDDGIENDARLLLDVGKHALQLLLRPDQWMHVFDRADVLILHSRCFCDRHQGLPRCVGDEVHVEQAWQRHGIDLLKLTCGGLFKTRRLSPHPAGSLWVERTTIGSHTAIPTSRQRGKMLFDKRPSRGQETSPSPCLTVLNKTSI